MSVATLFLLSLAVSAATVWGVVAGFVVGVIAHGLAREARLPEDEALFWAMALGGGAVVLVWQISTPAILRLLGAL